MAKSQSDRKKLTQFFLESSGLIDKTDDCVGYNDVEEISQITQILHSLNVTQNIFFFSFQCKSLVLEIESI